MEVLNDPIFVRGDVNEQLSVNSSCNDYNYFYIKYLMFPIFYNIEEDNFQFKIIETGVGGVTQTVALPHPILVTLANIALTLQTAINAAGLTYIYVVALDPLSHKLTISNPTDTFTLQITGCLAYQLGFPITTTYAGLITYTGAFPICLRKWNSLICNIKPANVHNKCLTNITNSCEIVLPRGNAIDGDFFYFTEDIFKHSMKLDDLSALTTIQLDMKQINLDNSKTNVDLYGQKYELLISYLK